MTGGARAGWRTDPYQRHELRYWDGLAWTARVSDVGVVGDDPVFPIADADLRAFLAPPRPKRRLPGLDRAAVWAIAGFFGVVGLAVATSIDTPGRPASLPGAATVEAAGADRPAQEGPDRTHPDEGQARVAGEPATGTPGTATGTATGTAPGTAAITSTPAPARARTALQTLVTLPVRPAATGTVARPTTSRPTVPWQPLATTASGRRHPKATRHGCDPRQLVLQRDLTRVKLDPGGCVVRSGVLRNPVSGASVRYVASARVAPTVTVATIIGTGDAWRAGAAHLDPARRQALALDPLNLVAVPTRATWLQHPDAVTWLPLRAPDRCALAARRVAVKARYGLWVTPAERRILELVLSACPSQPLPTGTPSTRRPSTNVPPIRSATSGSAGSGSAGSGSAGSGSAAQQRAQGR